MIKFDVCIQCHDKSDWREYAESRGIDFSKEGRTPTEEREVISRQYYAERLAKYGEWCYIFDADGILVPFCKDCLSEIIGKIEELERKDSEHELAT
jgi:hypothetical protein